MRNIILFHFCFLSFLLRFEAHSQDGWIAQSSGTLNDLYGLYFLDDTTGWVVGESGTILHTTTGGMTWMQQNSGFSEILVDVFFVNQTMGWTVGLFGTILHTTDGGKTWINQVSNDDHNLFEVTFTDTNTGWVAGDWQTLLHTTDGGITWLQQSITSYRSLEDFAFAGSSIGWLTGNAGDVFHTTDGGKTWVRQNSGTMQNLTGVDFQNPDIGWVVGGNFGTGGGGIILHTTDGGQTWSEQESGATNRFWDVDFVDTNDGWIVGGWYEDDESIILHTSSGGESWDVQSSGTTRFLLEVFFVDTLNGWTVGTDGTILHTIAGGVSSPVVTTLVVIDSLNMFVPAEGDTFAYSMTFTNHTSERQVVDWWTKLIRPVGDPMDPLSGPEILVLEPNTSAIIDTTQLAVPWNSEPGDYQLVAYVGRYLTDTLHTDTTAFIKLPPVSSVGTNFEVPGGFSLSQNYPNPFNPSTEIMYGLPERLPVRLEVFDPLGQRVAVLVDTEQNAGYHSAVLDSRGLASGLYFYRIQAGGFVETKRLIVLR